MKLKIQIFLFALLIVSLGIFHYGLQNPYSDDKFFQIWEKAPISSNVFTRKITLPFKDDYILRIKHRIKNQQAQKVFFNNSLLQLTYRKGSNEYYNLEKTIVKKGDNFLKIVFHLDIHIPQKIKINVKSYIARGYGGDAYVLSNKSRLVSSSSHKSVSQSFIFVIVLFLIGISLHFLWKRIFAITSDRVILFNIVSFLPLFILMGSFWALPNLNLRCFPICLLLRPLAMYSLVIASIAITILIMIAIAISINFSKFPVVVSIIKRVKDRLFTWIFEGHGIRVDIFVLLILTGFFLLYFKLFIFFNIGVIGHDNVVQFYPKFQYIIDCFKEGTFPLWDPYTKLGAPFYCSVVNCLFNPFFLIYFVITSLAAQTYYSFQALLLSGFLIGAILTYTGLRMMSISRPGALIGSIVYIFCGRHVCTIYAVNQVYTAGFIPFLFACFYRFMKYQSWRNVAVCSLVLSVFLSLGDGNYIVWGILIVVISLFFNLFFGSKSEPFYKIKYSAKVLSIFFLAVGTTAFWMLPALQNMAMTTRTALSGAWLNFSLWQQYRLINIILPTFFDKNFTPYMGILPLVLIIVYLAIARQKRNFIYLYIILGALGLLISANGISGLWQMLKTFPVFRALRFTNHPLVLYNFAIAFLSAYALDHFYTNRPVIPDKQKKVILFVIALSILLLLCSFWTPIAVYFLKAQSARLHIIYAYEALTLYSILGIGAVSGLILMKDNKKKMIFIFIMLVILSADLFYLRPGHLRNNANLLRESNPYQWMRRTEPFLTISKDNSLFRVEGFGNDIKAPYSLGFYSTSGYLPHCQTLYYYKKFVAGEYSKKNRCYDFFSEPHPYFSPDSRLYDFLNVKYFYVNDNNKKYFTKSIIEDLINKGELVQIRKDLYLNKNYLPRAFFTNSYLVNTSNKLVYHKSKDFDPKVPVLEEKPCFSSSGVTSYAEPHKIIYGINKVEIYIKVPAQGLVVLSDVLYPGWRAFIDGKETRIYKANYIFRAVEVEEGKHVIRFVFYPKIFTIGIFISILTLCTLFVLLFIPGRREH